MSAVVRGIRNPFRSRARAALTVLLLACIIATAAVMAQAAGASRGQIAALDARVRTLIELREAGAFGTGGFGGDKPVGEEHFTIETLDKVQRIPHARHLARVDEYVYKPDIDPSRKNAYAMVIGLRPGAALRAIGEIDYENARIIAGRGFVAADADREVAVVGRLYAVQRLGLAESDAALAGRRVVLGGRSFEVIGVYATGNDFGDNHVFVPLEPFRAVFRPGGKLSKIFVTVDSVANVERVVEDLKRQLPEADVVTTPEAVSTARTALGGLAAASAYGLIVAFATGAALIVFVMVLSVRERIREIGTLKAIGAANREVAIQFLAESTTLAALGAMLALPLAAAAAPLVSKLLGLALAFDLELVAAIGGGALVFAALGSCYPVYKGVRLSPVDALRSL